MKIRFFMAILMLAISMPVQAFTDVEVLACFARQLSMQDSSQIIVTTPVSGYYEAILSSAHEVMGKNIVLDSSIVPVSEVQEQDNKMFPKYDQKGVSSISSLYVQEANSRTPLGFSKVRLDHTAQGDAKLVLQTIIFSPDANKFSLTQAPELTPGHPSPPVFIMVLSQMKQLGVQKGSLKYAILKSVQNPDTVFELAAMKKNWGLQHPGEKPSDEDLGKMLEKTQFVRTVESILIQAGHRIEEVKFVWESAESKAASDVLSDMRILDGQSYKEGLRGWSQKMQKLGIKSDSEVDTDFDIQFTLAPF